MTPADFRSYIQTLRANISQGNATEHTHRPALQTLVEANAGISAINEPKRIDCGAPDFAIVKSGDNPLSIGYIETKDIGANLDRVENDDQLMRYRAGLSNLVLTNYTEFRWYVDGQLLDSAILANLDGSGSPSIADAGINGRRRIAEELSQPQPGNRSATPRNWPGAWRALLTSSATRCAPDLSGT